MGPQRRGDEAALDTKEGLLYIGLKKRGPYFALEQDPLRIRKELINERTIAITHKKRSNVDESKKISNTLLDPHQNKRLLLLHRVGIPCCEAKIQTGWRYGKSIRPHPSINCRNLSIEGLGWFIEVEALVNRKRNATKPETSCGVPASPKSIPRDESKSYLQLIG